MSKLKEHHRFFLDGEVPNPSILLRQNRLMGGLHLVMNKETRVVQGPRKCTIALCKEPPTQFDPSRDEPNAIFWFDVEDPSSFESQLLPEAPYRLDIDGGSSSVE